MYLNIAHSQVRVPAAGPAHLALSPQHAVRELEPCAGHAVDSLGPRTLRELAARRIRVGPVQVIEVDTWSDCLETDDTIRFTADEN